MAARPIATKPPAKPVNKLATKLATKGEAAKGEAAITPELGLCNALLSCFKPPQAAPVEAAVEPDYNGCYLLFTEARGGAFITHWSETRLPEGTVPLAYYTPHSPVAKFKYARGGQTELCRGAGGPNHKLFYQGWASFLRAACGHKGTLSCSPSLPLPLPLNLTLTLTPTPTPTLTLTLILTLTRHAYLPAQRRRVPRGDLPLPVGHERAPAADGRAAQAGREHPRGGRDAAPRHRPRRAHDAHAYFHWRRREAGRRFRARRRRRRQGRGRGGVTLEVPQPIGVLPARRPPRVGGKLPSRVVGGGITLNNARGSDILIFQFPPRRAPATRGS